MKNKQEKKIRFGRYVKRPYKSIRKLLKQMWKEEEISYPHLPLAK